ncbi:MAG: hypothetical protein QOJ26_1509 [Thermoplasmata archaeon]|jgi:hypothetical protein|nr:hypothetical protein [Thermoplasmata archaeon]
MSGGYTIGVVLLVLGGLALLGGLAWAANGYMKQQDNNQDDTVFTEPDNSQETAQMNTGFMIAGGGLVLAIIGGVLMRTSRTVVVA